MNQKQVLQRLYQLAGRPFRALDDVFIFFGQGSTHRLNDHRSQYVDLSAQKLVDSVDRFIPFNAIRHIEYAEQHGFMITFEPYDKD